MTSVNNYFIEFQLVVYTEGDHATSTKDFLITIFNCGKSGFYFSENGIAPYPGTPNIEASDNGRRLANPNKGGVPRTTTYNVEWPVLWSSGTSQTGDGGGKENTVLSASSTVYDHPASEFMGPNIRGGNIYIAGDALCDIISLEIKDFYWSESHRNLTLWTNETQIAEIGAIEAWITKPDRYSFGYEPVFHRRAQVAHTADEIGGTTYLLGFGARREYVWQHKIVNNYEANSCPDITWTLANDTEISVAHTKNTNVGGNPYLVFSTQEMFDMWTITEVDPCGFLYFNLYVRNAADNGWDKVASSDSPNAGPEIEPYYRFDLINRALDSSEPFSVTTTLTE